ncbi:MAG: tetratricopeptide repeat protein [Sphingobacteriales bacterium]|nr:MAG: tetratricopeptide repeat protein [Sphingobacteriales bacterium]
MKKTFLTFAAALLVLTVSAQKSNLRAANNYLSSNEFANAKKAIDEAATNEATATDPKTWALRGQVYVQLQTLDAFKASNPYREGATSLQKAITLGYKDADITPSIKAAAFNYFNDGAVASRAKDYTSAYEYFGQTVMLHDLDGGARFKGDKQFDTVASEARLQQVVAARELGKTAELVNLLEVAKNDPVIRQPYLHFLLAETYTKLGQTDKAIATFADGKKTFPGNKDLINGELNLYVKSGRTEEMMKRLEEAAAAEPSSPEVQFSLGNAYMSAAFPKGGETPSNYKDLVTKAEAAYTKTLVLRKDVVDYQYNAGTLFYNQGAEFNKQMNAISGTTTADMRKVDALKVQRDAMFARAQPYFEQVVSLLEGKGSSMSQDDKVSYQSALIGLREIYTRTNDTAKLTATKAKLSALK